MGKFKELKPIFSFTEWATKWAKWATKWAIINQDLKVILNFHNHLSFGNETHAYTFYNKFKQVIGLVRRLI